MLFAVLAPIAGVALGVVVAIYIYRRKWQRLGAEARVMFREASMLRVGQTVQIHGDHPEAGEVGDVVDVEDTADDRYSVVVDFIDGRPRYRKLFPSYDVEVIE